MPGTAQSGLRETKSSHSCLPGRVLRTTLQPGGGRIHVPSPRGGLAHTVQRGLFFSLLVPFNGYIFLKARTPTDSEEMSQRSKKETDSHASACERGTLAREPDSPRAPSPAPPRAKTLILTSRRKLLCMNAKSMIRSN